PPTRGRSIAISTSARPSRARPSGPASRTTAWTWSRRTRPSMRRGFGTRRARGSRTSPAAAGWRSWWAARGSTCARSSAASARRRVGADAPGLAAVGYRGLLACVEGRTDLATALAAVVRATRQFAKRQRTWFRREPAIVWHHPEREAGPIAAAVEAFLAGAAPAVRAPA